MRAINLPVFLRPWLAGWLALAGTAGPLLVDAGATGATLRIALAQPFVEPGHVEKNIEAMKPLIAESAGRGAKLVVFSECALTGYDLKGVGAKAALKLDAPELATVADLARRLGVAILAGFHEQLEGRLFNSAAVFFPNGHRVIQRKHLIMAPERAACPDIAGAPRERTFFEVDGFRCAVLICSDALIPGIYEDLAAAKCDAVILIAAGAGSETFGVRQSELSVPAARAKWLDSSLVYIDRESVARAIRLDLAHVAVNQSGWNPASGYFQPGGSSIIDRTGTVSGVIPARFVFEHLQPDLAVGHITRAVPTR